MDDRASWLVYEVDHFAHGGVSGEPATTTSPGLMIEGSSGSRAVSSACGPGWPDRRATARRTRPGSAEDGPKSRLSWPCICAPAGFEPATCGLGTLQSRRLFDQVRHGEGGLSGTLITKPFQKLRTRVVADAAGRGACQRVVGALAWRTVAGVATANGGVGNRGACPVHHDRRRAGTKPPESLRVYLYSAFSLNSEGERDARFEKRMAKNCLMLGDLDRERIADIDRRLGPQARRFAAGRDYREPDPDRRSRFGAVGDRRRCDRGRRVAAAVQDASATKGCANKAERRRSFSAEPGRDGRGDRCDRHATARQQDLPGDDSRRLLRLVPQSHLHAIACSLGI